MIFYTTRKSDAKLCVLHTRAVRAYMYKRGSTYNCSLPAHAILAQLCYPFHRILLANIFVSSTSKGF